MVWSGLDRRRFPRANYCCKINIKRKHMPPKVASTHTENIGLGGICVLINEDLKLFRDVALQLYLEDGKPPIDCEGTVVWVVKEAGVKGTPNYDTGIEFTNMKEEDKTRIAAIVNEVLKKQDSNRD